MVTRVAPLTEQRPRPEKLWRACKDFEAFLFGTLLQRMWRTAEGIRDEGAPFMRQAYRDFFTFEVARSLVTGMPLGIAEMLYRELSLAFPEGKGGTMR